MDKCENLNDKFIDTKQFICSKCGIELRDWKQVKVIHNYIGCFDKEEFCKYVFNYCPNCGREIQNTEELRWLDSKENNNG